MGVVVGVGVDVERGDLEPAAWFEVAKGFAEDVVVVADEAFELAAVDVVKGLVVRPCGFKVVDFKAAVGGGPALLVSLYRVESCTMMAGSD